MDADAAVARSATLEEQRNQQKAKEKVPRGDGACEDCK